jgi:hypothetical protein
MHSSETEWMNEYREFIKKGEPVQFGMNPFGTTRSLADWFASFGGHETCSIACGLFFVALSVSAASYFLKIEELKVLKRTEAIQSVALGSF